MTTQTQTINATLPVSTISAAYDVQKYRSLVPVLQQGNILYLNASYQPPMNTVVRKAIDRFLDEAVYHAHPKPEWQARTEKTRALVGHYINAAPDSISFTSDTTEGLNLFQRSLKFEVGDNVVVLDTEHPNQAYGWLALRERGLEVRQVATQGKLYADASTYAPLVDARTKAIGLSSIMFHSGQKNNVKDICDHFRPMGIQVLVDMTQEAGVAPVDVKASGVSAACFSFHKALGCPTGLAALYIDPNVLTQLESTPPVVGAGAIANLRADLVASLGEIVFHPNTRRYEHLNHSLVALHAANASLDLFVNQITPEGLESHLRSLGRELREECGKLGVEIIGELDESKRAPHLYVLKLLDPAWKIHFEKHATYVSCYRLGVRISFGFYNNTDDVRRLGGILKSGLEAGIPTA